MRYAFLPALLLLLTAPALAKDKTPVHDGAPLRYGMELGEAEGVIGDAALWRVAYRVDTESTAEFAAVWSGQVFYRLRFLDGKCCYIEKRAEVGPDEIDQLMQMYRGVYGDSPEATSTRDGRYIFARWQTPGREITISAVGRGGVYKLFYEELDPLAIGDARVAQERELKRGADVDPLTGQLRIAPLGQAAQGPEQEEPSEDDASATDESAADGQSDAGPGAKADDPDEQDNDTEGKVKRRPRPKPDPVTDDRAG